ncbi:MAG: hypothetical protein H6654_06835 [Ardenticatenaceae bacterium]|nr:hypothetical protein [Anaerolineales bacterium]MCB8973254.1 hypothetical protein [Ardenticatenaceae bacterium]
MVEKLTIEAQVCLACGAVAETAVSRGMSIQSSEGKIVGELAAVLVNGRTQQPTHLVLCCQLPDYRLVPLENVVGVYGRTVQLNLTREQISHLPQHQPKL